MAWTEQSYRDKPTKYKQNNHYNAEGTGLELDEFQHHLLTQGPCGHNVEDKAPGVGAAVPL
jgi:hypothetical protein